jgi:hypothetical protein
VVVSSLAITTRACGFTRVAPTGLENAIWKASSFASPFRKGFADPTPPFRMGVYALIIMEKMRLATEELAEQLGQKAGESLNEERPPPVKDATIEYRSRQKGVSPFNLETFTHTDFLNGDTAGKKNPARGRPWFAYETC